MEFAASDQPSRPAGTETGEGPGDAGTDPAVEVGTGSRPLAPSSPVEEAFAAPTGASWSRVSSNLAWYRRLLMIAALLPATALGSVAIGLWWGWPWGVGPAGLGVAAAGAGWLAAEPEARSWGYAEGSSDLYLTYGVVVRQLVVVPYGRMQVVDVTSNLLEQALGIATVRVRTAATTADTRIPGLRFDDAVVLRDRLAARSETFSTGL